MVPSRIRADGFYLLLLAGLVLAAMCYLLERNARAPMMDFRTAYFSAECLLRHCDPYKQSDVLALYAERADMSWLSARDRLVIAGNVYPPSEFAFIILFELLPFQTAQALWFLLIAMSFTVAAAAMFDLAAAHAHRIALALLCFAVVNCQSLIHYANPGAVAVSFCLVAVWCFLRDRLVFAGILLLAFSLLLKPQDAALIWLYFFIAGGAYRKRALQTLLVVAVLSLPMLLWVTHLSPHWVTELRATHRQFFAHGGINDPAGDHGTCAVTSLQAITSFFWADPHTYNLVSYLVCAPLLFMWLYVTWRARAGETETWLALASISVLALLPIYHRQYDAKIIILTLPACAILWARGGFTRWCALIVTAQAFVMNADLAWVWFDSHLRSIGALSVNSEGYLTPKMTLVMNFPVTLSLLALGTFYLWAYARAAFAPQPFERTEKPAGANLHPSAM